MIKKFKRINNAGLFSEPSLIIFTKGANNSDHDCIYIYTVCMCAYVYSQVFDTPIFQVFPFTKNGEICNFHRRYTSTVRDRIEKIQTIFLYDF